MDLDLIYLLGNPLSKRYTLRESVVDEINGCRYKVFTNKDADIVLEQYKNRLWYLIFYRDSGHHLTAKINTNEKMKAFMEFLANKQTDEAKRYFNTVYHTKPYIKEQSTMFQKVHDKLSEYYQLGKFWYENYTNGRFSTFLSKDVDIILRRYNERIIFFKLFRTEGKYIVVTINSYTEFKGLCDHLNGIKSKESEPFDLPKILLEDKREIAINSGL